ncbi:DUF4011 domain-containing protein [Methanobrevibacter millerae]|uniref:Superfamily I DNA and/or RNA helicase n=1 Tax=Methanobrevibacter millerae TaxID=230361 RepID=A0A1G5VJB5_9EURY|nr:DUF4011 domain-containing protein [Methanobrevibacter millerae]SDA45155.1 Superfamily I DNA and/or RNA helicase [Methanobrevibacter millerae]
MVCENNDLNFTNMSEEIEELRKKLLDMTLNNHLLNIRVLKRTIPIVDESIVEVFKILVLNEKSMEFLPKKDDDEEPLDELSEEDDDLAEMENIWTMVKTDSHKDNKYTDNYLQTDLTEKNLQKKLFDLFQHYKTSMTEQGFNNVYLALGFLEWNDKESQEKPYKAPLILIPVEITRNSVGSPFKIKWSQSDIVANISLQNKLKEQNVDFPIFEFLENEEDLCNYFSQVKEAISNKSDWNVSAEIYLSTFSFRKIVMYKDIDLKNWSKESKNYLNKLLFNPESRTLEPYGDFELDKIASKDLYQVLDADSSQMEVIEDVKKSNNIVVEGPPGTGKSQTIVNIIAELMANGKSVLFVSEKMAALEVVKRRLDAVNLGSACLELHSNKSNKRAVLDEIDKTLNDNSYYNNKSEDFKDLDDLKEELNDYICSLYESYGNTDFYPYKLFGIKEREQQLLEEKNQEILYFDIENLTNFNQIQQKDTLKELSSISNIYELVAPVSKNPWKNILPIDFTPNKLEIVKSDLNKITSNLGTFIDYSDSLSSLVNCSNPNDLNKFDAFLFNLNVIRPGLSVIEDENYLLGLIEKIEKYQNKLNSIDLNDKFSEELISKFKIINADLIRLTAILDDISLNLNCSNLDNFDGFEKHVENLSIIDPDLKIFENKYEVTSLVNNLRTYNENINSIKLDENLPENVNEYTDVLNQLIDDISYFSDASDFISENTSCSKLLNINQTEEWISNLNLLNPEIRIIEDKYAVKNCISLVESFQEDLNLFNSKDFSNEIKNYKEGVNSLLNNLYLLKNNISDFNKISGVKINDLKSIDRTLDFSDILKNSNLCILDNDLEELINKISQYQYYTKDINHNILELNLAELLSKTNSLIKDLEKINIQNDLILTENGENLLNQFNGIHDKIKNLPFINSSANPDFIKKLEIIQSNRNSILRDSDEQFIVSLNELKNDYPTDTDENKIFDDVELFLESNHELTLLKNQILKYCSNEISNEEIINELKIFIKIQDQISDIKNKLSEFISINLKSVEDLQSNLVNLVLFKELYDFILSKEELGKRYFGDLWNSVNSNVDDLINRYLVLREFNDLYDSEFFTEDTLDKLSAFDKSLFLNNSNKIRNIKKDINQDFNNVQDFLELNTESIYSKNITDLHSSINNLYGNLEVLDKWELFKLDNSNNKENLLDFDLQSVEHSVKELQKYSTNPVFSNINEEINNLSKINQSRIEIESNDILAKTYFFNDWKGANSNLNDLKERYEKLEEFNNLVDSGFYPMEIEDTIQNLNYIDFNLRLNNIQKSKDKISDNISKLKDLSLKNLDINSIGILEFKEKLKDLLADFNNIKDWYGFKSSIGINNVVSLYYYDFDKLNNSVNTLSYYFDCNEFLNRIIMESSDLNSLKDLKELIDSNEIGEKYFVHYWKRSSSDINEINEYFERLNKFNDLVISQFYTSKTEESLSKLNSSDFNGMLSKLSSLKERIFDNFNALNSLNIFKNLRFNSMPLKDLSQVMSTLVENLNTINDWQVYKNGKISLRDNKLNEFILDLFDYDFDKVKYSFSNLLIECNFNNELEKEVNNILELKDLKETIDNNDEEGKKYFKNLWNGVSSNVSELKDFSKDLIMFNQLLNSGFYTEKTLSSLETLDYEEFDRLKIKLADSNDNIHNSFNELNTVFDFNEILDDENNFNLTTRELKEKFDILDSNYELLTNWRLFCLYSKNKEKSYLKNIIPLIWDDKIKPECIISLFKFNVATNILNEMIEYNINLMNFNETLFNEKIESFKELDKRILEINQYRVKQILHEQIPSTRDSIQMGSELGILMHEIDKKRRKMPIRKLLAQAANVIGKIKPCFMMSPISVAQYLDSKVYANHFDYVIFDEASQIKTEDAIGAFLRGKNFVIMGDSKQLPPTHFFDGDVDDEDDESLYKDIESILKICRTVFPYKMLKWHYRSRHESLISVSNYEFYNNDLIVFPSPFNESKNLGLKHIYNPDNIYDKGNSAKNRGEAKDVIDYAITHFKEYGKSKSLGIATFGSNQKNAILEELEFRLRNNPELEPLFDESGENGFFIKNLENIQGDERDVILISIGYGFDKDHKFSMNFGPLNNDGGERRLNVLITRAREKCVVFSNFLPSDLKITKKSGFGIKALKTFLCYAKYNKFPQNIPTEGDFDSPFEESVYNFLTAYGYEVKKQIGCAGYRIDLAIVDPENSDKYVLGIECDGTTYHSSKTARDRDRLRQQVLENLGWKFYRIWSTDWFNSRISAQKRLIEVVEKALINKDKEPAPPERPKYEPEPTAISPTVEYFKDYVYFKDNVDLNNYNLSSRLELKDLVRNMVKLEGPVHIDDIYDTMKIILSSKRKDKKFKKLINSLINYNLDNGIINHSGEFYFDNSFDKNNFIPRKRKKPKLDRIYDEELKLAVINTLKLQFDAPKEDLIKASSINLGFSAVGKNINKKFDEIIDELTYEGKIKSNKNGTLGLNE